MATKRGGGGGSGGGARDRYDTYVYNVLKRVHPDLGITRGAMRSVETMVRDLVARVCTAANDLTLLTKKQTVTAREIHAATRQVIQGDSLVASAVSDALRAVTKYTGSFKDNGGRAKVAKSRAQRAGLVFSPARVERQLRACSSAKRVGENAPVYLAAVAESITGEILELAGDQARDSKRKRITPRDLTLVLRGNEPLDRTFSGFVAGGGVLPHIHRDLLPPPSKKAKTAAAAAARSGNMLSGWDDRFDDDYDDDAELDYVPGHGDYDYDDDDE